jgi:DNA-binding CsgD family transcriptional regulator
MPTMTGLVRNIGENIHLLSPDQLHGRLKHKYLKEKIKILEEIVFGLDAVVFIHDLESNRHIWTNGNYKKLIGYEEAEILQLGLDEARVLFHPDDMKIILEGVEFLRNNKSDSFSGIYRIRHKLGHWILMYCHASIIQCDKRGSPSLALGFAVDFSPHIQSATRLNELIAENRQLVNHIRLNCLTRREKEILIHLTGGLTCKEISDLLGISYLTVETHIKNIHRKLGLSHISALVNFAVESGLKA